MATNKTVLYSAFGSATFFRDAYNYDLTKIYKWMDDVCDIKTSTGGPQSQKAEYHKILVAVCQNVKDLSLPNGKRYKDAKLQPFCHFLRKSFDKPWNDQKDQPISKFDIEPWPCTYLGPGAFKKTLNWWNPYDLLGLFLGILGPAPQGADIYNYFLPLTAVYARWCSRIAGRAPRDKKSGAGDWPYMFQCTWHEERYDQIGGVWFFLGASTAGDEFNTTKVGQWRARVQLQRFNMLWQNMDVKVLRRSDFDKNARRQEFAPGGSVVPYGNCAETYPFAIKVVKGGSRNGFAHGLALQRFFLRDTNLAQEYKEEYAKGYLVGPCANCRYLIKRCNMYLAQFEIGVDKEKPPRRPQTTASQNDQAGQSNSGAVERPEDQKISP